MVEELGNVWVEAQIDGSAISLSLMSESTDGATVEETARYTFGELQEMTGESFSLSLSDDTRNDLSDLNGLAVFGDAVKNSADTLSKGDIAVDENAPSWSVNDRVEVVEVLDDVTCKRYVIEGHNEGYAVAPIKQHYTDKTAADANPSYDSDDTVILARYTGGPNKAYAFPSERLESA